MSLFTLVRMCRGVEKREWPFAAGRSFAVCAPPPGRFQLRVGQRRIRHVSEYLHKQDNQN